MNLALIASGALLGLASGGHCVAMCSAGSSFILGTTAPLTPRATALRLGSFHAGRISSYAFVGGLLGGASAAFHVLTEWTTLLRPLWTMANTAMFLLGMALLITARQPHVLTTMGEKLGRWLGGSSGPKAGQFTAGRVQGIVLYPHKPAIALRSQDDSSVTALAATRPRRRGLALGLSWAFIPCGPLYTVWTLALFTGDAWSGALTAAAFAVASGAQLAFAQWWFARVGQSRQGSRSARWDKIGVRVAGLALCLSAGYSIAMLVSGVSPSGAFCL